LSAILLSEEDNSVLKESRESYLFCGCCYYEV